MEQAHTKTRAEGLLVALAEASLAASRATTAEQVYRGAVTALKRQGYEVNIFVLQEDGRARLDLFSYAPRLIAQAEKITGISAKDFALDPVGTPVFHDLFVEGRSSFSADANPVVQYLMPGRSKVLAAAVVRVLGIRRLLASPIRSDDAIIGAILLLYDEASERDLPALDSFSHLLGITASRVDLLARNQANLARLEQAQARLLHSQRLETLGLLTAGIAHDVNNLLTPGIFAVDLLRPLVAEEGQRWLTAIEGTLQSTAALTRQLLAAGARQQLEVASIDVDGLVRQCAELLRPALGEAVVVELSLHGQSRTVRADKSQLEQVLLNLVLNARDALAPGGTVTISTALEARDGVAGILLQVADDGAGMDADTLARAVEPFFSTKASGVGAGLGLAVSDGIVSQHGGLLSLRSEVGRGTQARVWLPLSDDAPRMPLPPLQPVQPDLMGVAWVVEDRPAVRMLVATALRDCGATVSEAADLAQARQLLDSGDTPQLVVSDIVLPDGFGVDFVEEVHRRWPDVVVLFMSGHPMDDDVARRVQAIAGRYLAKPFTRDQLLQSVAAALGQWAMMGI